ncbi:UNVERIFIED_CONTAM: hypothetical protein GTU68_027254 [Idotea baltica]|nr:hypothetical protein [Idotea baltica]
MSVDEVDLQYLSSTSGKGLIEGEFGWLASHRHSRKLRRGAHQHNNFSITVRDIANVGQRVDHTVSQTQGAGFANYFGPQRFGINYQNLPKAKTYFSNSKRKITRTQRSLLISSARSQLFNRVCAARVKAGTWNEPLLGEPMMLSGTHSFFTNDGSDDVVMRCSRHDVHPTGPMWGSGESLALADCKQMESYVLRDDITFLQGLEKAGLKQQRRALRATVNGLSWQWQSPEIVTFHFKLLKGVYATCFLSEFMIY